MRSPWLQGTYLMPRSSRRRSLEGHRSICPSPYPGPTGPNARHQKAPLPPNLFESHFRDWSSRFHAFLCVRLRLREWGG